MKKYTHPETSTLHQGELIDTKGGVDIVECEHCGFKHIIPIPLKKDLELFYKNEYFSDEKPKYFEEEIEDLSWWDTVYQEYFHLFEVHLKKSKGSLLEIGSGSGQFLRLGKKLGWEVTGIEPSIKAYEYSKQFDLHVINDFFTPEVSSQIGSFDVIFLDMVLEHVPDPINTLNLAKKLLNDKGIICIISPNDYNPLQSICKDHLNYEPWWVVPHHHINYFSIDSIQQLLEKLSFQVLETTASFPMEFFLLSGKNYIANPELGREMHEIRMNFEKCLYKANPDIIRTFYRTLAKSGIGRSFVAIASKNC